MDLPVLWLIAGSMAVFTAWLLKRGSTMKTVIDAGIVIFLLVMMASMFLSAVVYLYFPGLDTIFELVALNMISMSIALIPILTALFRGNRQIDLVSQGRALPARYFVYGAIIVLVILSEMFMGWTFAIISGAASTTTQSAPSSLVTSMSTYWFIFTMAGEMAVTLYLVGKNFPPTFRWLVAIQAVLMVLSPTAITNSTWAWDTLAGNTAVMIVAIVVMLEYVFRNRTMPDGASKYVVRLIGAYGLMMLGLFIWQLYGDVTVFVLSIVAEMCIYFTIVLDDKRLTNPPLVGWQTKPLWAFALLGGIFFAEFFMGGVLDIMANGTSYFTTLPFVTLSGSALTVLGAALLDFVVAVGSVTASVWFLAMMGVEMGALVVFKIKYARETETKMRLGLMLAAYAIYAIWLPSFVFHADPQNIPWIGWSMGIGTAGAITPGIVLLALVFTYVISGGLSFLFGSRNVCSVLCTAAPMYQGTTYDAMSTFNRTSKIGRHNLTSRASGTFRVVSVLVWVSLLGSAALSYLTSIGVVNVAFFGTDVSYFFYAFYFSFLWYLVWILTPFLGTYGCVTTGMCGWGTFNGLVSRFGLFRLKVKDSNTCFNCETKDCAKVCPTGQTDLPGQFIDKGEFRSFKCVGIGDCVSACPYENIYFFDVRNWARTKLHKPLPPLARPVRTEPMESPIDFRAFKSE
ncbi:MAG: 4Fe-4S dicluster domain-containing protein [Thaumarchaeota archaeon]|nr:4Fe-4S dicluster domain-containing protein [Nitrososphaerota archaeon]